MTLPTLTHVVCNAVLVCSCPARVVLVLNVIGGTVECTSCNQKWKSPAMRYSVAEIPGPSTGAIGRKISIEVDLEPESNLIIDLAKLAGGKSGS